MRTLLLLLLLFQGLHGGISSALDAIKIIKVKSLQQKIVDRNLVLLDGDVSILLDHKIHIRADHVEVDKANQTIIAKADPQGFVILENQYFVMLAEYIELDLGKRTGHAKHIKIHLKEGFLSSSKAEKIDDQTWSMDNFTYTACDRPEPHWSFYAFRATLYKNSVLKASGLFFKIKNMPVLFFPGLLFPLQNRAGSGFLIPKISFDSELGFGFRQEYYRLIGPHCDTTVGVHMVQKKGFILSDEFRWAHSPENFLIVHSHYAEEWNAFLERKGRIISATDTHYWVQGQYFQPLSFGKLDFRTLVRFDFGTDKRIGYHFLDESHRVEDSFFNSVIHRYRDKKNMVQLSLNAERVLRRQFYESITEVSQEEPRLIRSDPVIVKLKEREEKVMVSHLPGLSWSTSYKRLCPFLFYRHDLLFDHAFLESRNKEKVYSNLLLDQVFEPIPSVDVDTTRFFYRGELRGDIRFLGHRLHCFVQPHVQLRNKVDRTKSTERQKTFVKMGAEWALPAFLFHTKHYSHHAQPLLRWKFLPKVYQDNFYHIDRYDRFYPEHCIELGLRNSIAIDGWDIDLFLTQGYDFYDSRDIYPLRRSYDQRHILPLHMYVGARYEGFMLDLTQEYSVRSLSLLQSELVAHFLWNKYDFFAGYVYQKELLQRDRNLLSDISAFAMLGCNIPLGNDMQFSYRGNFYSKYTHAFPFFNMMKPMLHRLRLDYQKHCWGVSLGYEEKRYRQYGKWKSERTVTLSLRLESIGSFAQKFKRPVIYKAPPEYRG